MNTKDTANKKQMDVANAKGLGCRASRSGAPGATQVRSGTEVTLRGLAKNSGVQGTNREDADAHIGAISAPPVLRGLGKNREKAMVAAGSIGNHREDGATTTTGQSRVRISSGSPISRVPPLKGLRKNSIPCGEEGKVEETEPEVLVAEESQPAFTEQEVLPSPPFYQRRSTTELPKATPVAGSSRRMVLPQAKQVRPSMLEQEDQGGQKERRRKRVLCCICALSLVILTTGLGVGLGRKRSDDASSDEVASLTLPSQSPTTMSFESHVLSLFPEHTLITLEEDMDSPQARAYNWTMADPNLMAYSDERIVQRFALGCLFYATSGDAWHHKTNWLSYELHECEWHAQDIVKILEAVFEHADQPIPDVLVKVSMDPLRDELFPCEDPVIDQKYTHLALLFNNLQGHIPPELYLLTSLKVISLQANGLTGSGLSTEIGKLSSLESMAMVASGVGSTIPTETGLLSSMHTLSLSTSKLTGKIPSQIGLLSNNLKVFDVFDNQLTGTLPESLGSLKEAQWLALSRNALSGTIPTELGMLTKTQEIYLNNNNLSGSVPWEIANLVTSANLQVFQIYNNKLNGSLPDDLCLIDTVSDYNNALIGCNCTCSFEKWDDPGFPLCSPLPNRCS